MKSSNQFARFLLCAGMLVSAARAETVLSLSSEHTVIDNASAPHQAPVVLLPSSALSLPEPSKPELAPTLNAPATAVEPLVAPSDTSNAPGSGPAGVLVEEAIAEPAGDLWQRIREGFSLSDTNGLLVARHRAAFAREPTYVDRIVERSRRYLFYITEEVEKRGMPTEIALLPIVESAFNPKAYSRAHASGIWQFIPATGKRYGLAQNWWYDGRRDIMAATEAALDYLQALHNMFDDWNLALAAYNCGEGCVRRAVARNRSLGLPTDFDELPLPRETRNYVPKLLAVRDIVKQPDVFGITLAPIPNERYFSSVITTRHIDVSRAAQFAEISTQEFLDLNPAYNRPVITAHTEQVILVPAEKADFFRANLENPDKPLLSWKAFKLQRGASFDKVASNFGMTGAELKRVNGIAASKRVAGGGTILVPTDGDEAHELPEEMQPEAQVPAPYTPNAGTKHRVRRGETLASIARRYRVSMNQLKAWNGLRYGKVIAGRMLVVSRSAATQVGIRTDKAAQSAATHYVVRRGDSWFSIARRFNVSVASLQSWNKTNGRRSLLAGTRIVVRRV